VRVVSVSVSESESSECVSESESSECEWE